jgi:hypothetical protein
MGGLLDSAAGPRAIIFEHECGKENIGGSYAGNIISRLKRHGFERIFGITRRGDLLAIAGESRTREIHTHEIENYIAMTNRQK